MRLQPSNSRLVGSSQLPMALVSFASLGRKPEIAGMFVMAALVPCPRGGRQGHSAGCDCLPTLRTSRGAGPLQREPWPPTPDFED